MRYTKGVMFGAKHASDIGVIRLKKKRLLNKLFNSIAENKFIIAILTGVTILTVLDLILVNAFFNLITSI